MECGGNQISECTKCNILLFQLQKTLTELKSSQFIIKILQDELNKSGVPRDLVGSGRQNTSETSRNDWKLVSGKNFSKSTKCSAHTSQHDIITTNRYDVLSKIQTLSDEAHDKVPVEINDITSLRNRTQKALSRISAWKLGNNTKSKFAELERSNVVRSDKKNEHKVIILGDTLVV
jgi:hypothetical protein